MVAPLQTRTKSCYTQYICHLIQIQEITGSLAWKTPQRINPGPDLEMLANILVQAICSYNVLKYSLYNFLNKC